jgi:hypothetical protein
MCGVIMCGALPLHHVCPIIIGGVLLPRHVMCGALPLPLHQTCSCPVQPPNQAKLGQPGDPEEEEDAGVITGAPPAAQEVGAV